MINHQPHKKYLSAALEGAGYGAYSENRNVIFRRKDGVALTSADELAIETLLNDYDYVAVLRAEAKARHVEQSQAYVQAIEDQYPEFEKRTWPDQKIDVLAFRANPNASTPTLDDIAAYRGVERLVIIEAADAKVSSMHAIATKLSGHRQKLEDEIDASTEEAFLETVEFTPPE